MNISGLQKLTLLDYPGLVACTVFTGGCNLRCPFCHNAELVLAPDKIPEDEVLAFLESRRGKLDGICVSGGEPLMHDGLPDFLRKTQDMGFKIKLDTNGCYPDRLSAVIEAGLANRIAMDIKASPEKYAEAAGIPGLDFSPIAESAALLMAGDTEYEFRTTAVKGLHDAEDFRRIGECIAGAREYFLQNFVDSGALLGGAGQFASFTDDEMRDFLEIMQKMVPNAKIRGA